jgi:hypothetical protein
MGTDRKGGSGTTMYMATLARNACHFAPESWHSWEDHHHKALNLARQAHAEQDGKKKDAKLNEALLVNGFGDHYLQDSYAAGHLINKTKIMQMYVRHLDRNPPVTAGYTTDPTWRAFQSMAYNQDGLTDDRQYDKSRIGRRDIGGQQVTTAQNPQAVENTQSLGNNFNWQDRFKMLGLTVPTAAKPGTPAWKLLVWMQKQRGGWLTTRYEVNFDAKELQGKAREIGISKLDVNDAIRSLLDGNIIYKIGESRRQAGDRLDIGEHSVAGMFTLRKDWVVSITGSNEKKFNSAVATSDTGDSPEYDKMAQATVYKDYVLFMRDSYLQKATNAAHDYFCEEGLKVSSGQGKQLFQIYGDYNMLEKDSSVGLRDSAETSNMSRDSVLAMANTGAEPPGKDTATILDRLPSWVEPPEGGAAISLADWQTRDGKLEAWLGPNVFDKMNVGINLAMGVVGNLGKITEDENVHGGEAF